MKELTFKNIKDIARGRWGFIVAALAGDTINEAIERGANRHSVCPIHGGNKPFRIFKDFEETGGCICSQCGAFSDGFSFLQEMHHWTSHEVLRNVASVLGVGNESVIQVLPARKKIVASAAIDEKEIEQRQQRVIKLWKEALPTTQKGTEPIIRYIYNRGLDVASFPATLKMLLSHGYYEDETFVGNYSVMVAAVLSPQGTLVALHRTYITFQGIKAEVECPKKLYTIGRSLKGAAIRLFSAEQTTTLGVCEGIETALAVHQMTSMVVWPCISAALLAQVEIPSHIKEVYIWVDKDRSKAGQTTALKLAERLYDEGFEVHIKTPPLNIPAQDKSIDWLDVLNQKNSIIRRTA